MLGHETAHAAIRDAIQTGYGDATQTVLDQQVAANILQSLIALGWVGPTEIALLMTGVQMPQHDDSRPDDRIVQVTIGDLDVASIVEANVSFRRWRAGMSTIIECRVRP